MRCWLGSEPGGLGRWTTVLTGTCDGRVRRRLLDEGRALALVGANEIDVSLAGVDTLTTAGAVALRDLRDRLALVGVAVRIGGAVGPADVLLRHVLRAGTDGGPLGGGTFGPGAVGPGAPTIEP